MVKIVFSLEDSNLRDLTAGSNFFVFGHLAEGNGLYVCIVNECKAVKNSLRLDLNYDIYRCNFDGTLTLVERDVNYKGDDINALTGLVSGGKSVVASCDIHLLRKAAREFSRINESCYAILDTWCKYLKDGEFAVKSDCEISDRVFNLFDAINCEGIDNTRWKIYDFSDNVVNSRRFFGTKEDISIGGKVCVVYCKKGDMFEFIDPCSADFYLLDVDMEETLYFWYI
ncbi:MAG: hypothetical protein VZR36_06445 [Prevotella sp.]|nr:hypothetical protein [Prevotella sp.]